ncbi:GAF domain-containing sensor histidine kinase [Pelagibius sp. Alg239-R121]|uniref:sensor histidine kinase n=1 Tax=Pelagibius sp. Alg239-R121 TaxID=2993448 RepID=UPI0024A63B1D|nr:GAF domain-containing sensor histidine kinase [Pelagibius sp. Alg239-R121]
MVDAPDSKRAEERNSDHTSVDEIASRQDWNTVLELLATGAPLQLSLEAIIGKAESHYDGMRCAIMALDSERSTLRHLAAPSVADWYLAAIDGTEVGPTGHCCAVSAFNRRRVVVKDIEVDAQWLERDSRAGEAGLRACWCQPVFSMSGNLLGTFAAYHEEPHVPSTSELEEIMTAARLTGIAMERTRNDFELRLAKESAERASRAKSEFLASVSHELRTPLNAILGFSEIMKDGLLGPKGVEKFPAYASDIHSSARHLLDLINDVLDLSRVESGHGELHPEAVEVKDLIAASISLVREQAVRSDVTLKSSVDDLMPILYADPLKMKQVVVNLLTNAIKFSPSGGMVLVRAGLLKNDDLEISVTDSGIGMSRSDIKVALEPFRQVENVATRSRQGVGLGLPLSKTLVELHKGSLDIESHPGQGTTVRVRMPADRLTLL